MRLLLDTHVLLWAYLEPERIAAPVSAELESSDNEIFLSPISIWECMVLGEKGRVRLLPSQEEWLRARLRELQPKEAAVTTEVAIRSRTLALPHSDPADRFIAATALVFDLTLVTADTTLLEAAGFRSMNCRA